MTIRAIAALMDVNPARVQQVIAETDQSPVLDQIRSLRQRWGVDTDPATRAAADHIIANLVAAAQAQPNHDSDDRPQQSGSTNPTLFDIA